MRPQKHDEWFGVYVSDKCAATKIQVLKRINILAVRIRFPKLENCSESSKVPAHFSRNANRSRPKGESNGSRTERNRIQESIARWNTEIGTLSQLAQSHSCGTTRAQRLRLAACGHATRADGQRAAFRYAFWNSEWRCGVARTRRGLSRSRRDSAIARYGRGWRARSVYQHGCRGPPGGELRKISDDRNSFSLFSAAQHEQRRPAWLRRQLEQEWNHCVASRNRGLHQKYR